MKIAAQVSGPASATSFYRGIGPLQEMSHQGVDVTVLDQISWAKIGFCDIYFSQRPATESDLRALYYAKNLGVQTWIDYDDNLFEVPISNPNWSTYSKKGLQKSLHMICYLADIITVSTEPLKKVIHEKTGCGDKVHVVKNAKSRIHTHQDNRKIKQIVWRGGSTHVADLLAYKDQIEHIAHNNPEWSWLFLGEYPWILEDAFKGVDVKVMSAPETPSYLKMVSMINSAIGIVPLEFNSFNECKSNIAEIEFHKNTIATLVPDMCEWLSPYRYTKDNFASQLQSMIDSIETLKTPEIEFPHIEDQAKMRINLLEQLF